MRIITIITLAILLPFLSLGQQKEKKPPMRRQLHNIAYQQILDLKEGALLVRLGTREQSIAALKKVGRMERAAKVKEEIDAQNKELVRIMSEEFTFCPVYYFFSDDVDKVMRHQLDSVKFLDNNLNYDPSIKVNKERFLTLSYGRSERDTVYRRISFYETQTTHDPDKEEGYYKTTDFSGKGPIFYSDQFIQLQHPFPYSLPIKFVSALKGSYVSKPLNKKLYLFYQRALKRVEKGKFTPRE